MNNLVAIIGRPNVGKSTLFNRLVGSREAIEDPTSGVTRDRHYGKCDWNGKEFSVVDTGGYVEGSDDTFEGEIRKQVEIAIIQSEVLLFIVDAKEGITALDSEVARMLRKTDKKVFLVANKVDNYGLIGQTHEFYGLGFGEVYCVSAVNGSGTGDFLDALVETIGVTEEEILPDIPKIAIIGRPNVGKSSLINSMTGEEGNIVTEISGTTRDSIHTRYRNFGFDMLLIDTAGIRKKSKVHENVEFYSVVRSISAIEESDICVLIIDAERGVESQDLKIIQVVERNNKGLVIAVNKWDLIEKSNNSAKEYEQRIKEKIAPFTDVPILFISALTKQRVYKVLDFANEVYKNRSNKITTSELNEVFLPIIENTPPPTERGKYVRIKYITQLKTPYPSFAFFCNHPEYVKTSYKRFLENKLRELYNFSGVVLKIYFRQK